MCIALIIDCYVKHTIDVCIALIIDCYVKHTIDVCIALIIDCYVKHTIDVCIALIINCCSMYVQFNSQRNELKLINFDKISSNISAAPIKAPIYSLYWNCFHSNTGHF